MYHINKKRKIKDDETSLCAYKIAESDDNMKYLVGWPGYRTSGNKSGLGYIETRAELAHMQGRMIRWLFTCKFRTYNPFYLLGMLLIGIVYGFIPVVFILYEVLVGKNWLMLLLLITTFPNIAIGILLIINTILSLLHWKKEKSITGD